MTENPSFGQALDLMGRLLMELVHSNPDEHTAAQESAAMLLQRTLDSDLPIHPEIADRWREMLRVYHIAAAYRSCLPPEADELPAPQIDPDHEAARQEVAAYDALNPPQDWPEIIEDELPTRSRPRVQFEP